MGFFERLSVRGKVMGGFAVVIIFTILISIVSVLIMLNFNSASSYAHEVLTVRRVTLVTVREMIDTMHDDLFMSQEELENNTPELLKGIEEKVNAVSAKVKALRGRTTPEQTAIIKNSIAEYENLYLEAGYQFGITDVSKSDDAIHSNAFFVNFGVNF